MERKFFSVKVLDSDESTLTVRHFISTDMQDRSGDIIEPDGMVLDGVPSVLKQHGKDPDTGGEPIAKCLGLEVGTDEDGHKGIIATTQYYDGSHLAPPDSTGRRLFEKAIGEFMPYWSIGFAVEKWKGIPGGGRHITKWHLFEYSQVGVPDNVTAKGIQPDQCETLVDFAVDTKGLQHVKPRIELNACWTLVDYFMEELHFASDTKEVKKLVKELAALLEPHAVAYVEEIIALTEEEGKSLRERLSKMRQTLIVKSNEESTPEPEEPPAPVDAGEEPPAGTEEETEPVEEPPATEPTPEEEPEPEPEPDNPPEEPTSPVKGYRLVTEKSTPPKRTIRVTGLSSTDLKSAISDMAKNAAQAEIDKAKGRVS